jgi:hypothetical protein
MTMCYHLLAKIEVNPPNCLDKRIVRSNILNINVQNAS